MSKIKKLSTKEFISIYSKIPRLCIDLVVQTKKGIILTKRAITPWKGMWHLPGGTLLLNENIEKAIKRIAREELNLIVSIKKMLGFMEFFCNSKSYPKHSVSIVFLVQTKPGKIFLDKQASEVNEFKILPKHIIPEHGAFLKGSLNLK